MINTKKYTAIVADPPWRYTFSTRKSELDGTGWHIAPAKYYKTLPLEAIKSFDVESISSENSICFLWVVNPMLPKCLTVLSSWGFDYRGMLTWVKTDKKTGSKPFFGTGYWARGATEHLVFGVRGKIKPLSRKETTWFQNKVLSHSEKPDTAFTIIERIVGDVPRLEMFARKQRSGWDVFGNEVENSIEIPLKAGVV